MATVYCLGWDVGSWQCSGDSQDALVLLAASDDALAVSGHAFHDDLLSKLDYNATIDGMLGLVGCSSRPDQLVIAIDAVFGWPVAFRSLADGVPCYKHSGKASNLDNRYLYRETERFLGGQFKFGSNPPMTAVGGAIGSAATKVQDFIHRSKDSAYVPPLDPWNTERARTAAVTIIEVYPGATRHSSPFQELEVPAGTRVAHLGKGDPQDAQRCAITAACYAATTGAIALDLPNVFTPADSDAAEDVLKVEGWIFTPRP